MAQNITIGFIGYGNMAQAIAQGLVDAGVVNGGDIVACAAHYDKLEASTAKLGARPLHNAREVAAAADVVIIAIKPYQIESVIKPIADEFAKNGRFVVSIAAGWDLAKYRKVFESLFGPISLIERVDTAHMTIAMVVAGCAPAFTDMYIEALGDAGVQYGLQRATAYRLAAKMVEGVGALYMATGTHPGAMKDAVCSPGGTTIRGVAKLEKGGFRGAVIDAVDAIAG